MLDNNKIVEALRTVKDPNSGRDIITMQKVSDFKIEGDHVFFTLKMSDYDAQAKSSVNFACIESIQRVYPEAQVHVHIEGQKAKGSSNLPQVKNIIAVGSGKGGVGKSTVAVNTAIALAKTGVRVGLIDADLYGPSIPTMMGLQGERPQVEIVHGKHKLIPLIAHGVSVISIGFIVEPEQAVVLRGPRLAGIVKQFIHDCIWPDLDYLLIDLPPGTGDIQLTLVQTLPITGALMVTTPQKVAVIDAIKAINMFMLDNVNVPILGIVENMAWFSPEELPDNKYYIFGHGGGAELAVVSESKLLAQIPLIQGIRESGDAGHPIAGQSSMYMTPYFDDLASSLIRRVDVRNREMDPTRVVQVSK